jgi:hypothetical protein
MVLPVKVAHLVLAARNTTTAVLHRRTVEPGASQDMELAFLLQPPLPRPKSLPTALVEVPRVTLA